MSMQPPWTDLGPRSLPFLVVAGGIVALAVIWIVVPIVFKALIGMLAGLAAYASGVGLKRNWGISPEWKYHLGSLAISLGILTTIVVSVLR